MKTRAVFTFFALLIFTTLNLSQPSVGEFHTISDGDWSNPNIWVYWNGSAWLTPLAPPDQTANIITISSGTTVTITTSINADQLVVEGTLDLQSGGSLILYDGSKHDLRIYGTFKNAGSIFLSEIGVTQIVKTGGVYQHNFTTTAGNLIEFVWEENSTCEIIGYTTYTGIMNVASQTFWNVTWNCEEQENQVGLDSIFSNMQGNFTIISTGKTGSLSLSYGKNYVVNGNFRQEDGQLLTNYGWDHGQLEVIGNAEFIGGSVGNNTFPSTSTIILSGTTQTDLLIENDYLFDTGAERYLDLIVDTFAIRNIQQNANIDGAYLRLYGTLICNEYVLSGTSLSGFTMYPGSTLNTAHTHGIHTSPTNLGSIQTGSRIYESDATYIYSRIGKQDSGPGLPDSVAKLAKTNGYGVLLEKTVTITDTLALGQGSVILFGDSLIIGLDATIIGPFSDTNMIVIEEQDSRVIFNIDKLCTLEFPVGTGDFGTFKYSPASIELTAGEFKRANIGLYLDDIKDPFNLSSVHYINRYWNVHEDVEDENFAYNAEFYYDDTDISGDETKIYNGMRPNYPVVRWNQLEDLVDYSNNKIFVNDVIPYFFKNTPIGYSGGNYDEGVVLNLKLFLQGAYR